MWFCLAVEACKKIVFRWGYEHEMSYCRMMVRVEFCSSHREKLCAALSRFGCLILSFFSVCTAALRSGITSMKLVATELQLFSSLQVL